MEQIWAPWRKAYIRPSQKKSKKCLFCRLLSENKDKRNYILKRTRFSFAILNLYPYMNGHAMIVPKRHVDSVHALSDQEKLDWLDLYEEIRLAIHKAMKCHGFNVGINVGKVGGAGVPHHLHLHIVPRWMGDSNFMPVIGQTKVISESLKSVYETLKKKIK
ncbi:MAG: HIT domain-containing protein [Candidatus Omnitrophica bacterium]|nr:HIT domain-containing protein [Candidatus Omnitrophota bacterium]